MNSSMRCVSAQPLTLFAFVLSTHTRCPRRLQFTVLRGVKLL